MFSESQIQVKTREKKYVFFQFVLFTQGTV